MAIATASRGAGRAHQATDRRERLTVSLPSNTVRFLKQSTSQEKASSVSAYLETLIEAFQRNAEREQLNCRMLAYYDGLSDAAQAEEKAWGEIADLEFKTASL